METLHWSSRSPIGVDRHRGVRGHVRAAEPRPPAAAAVPRHQPPQLSIQTGWRTASPEEVESELLEPLENVMQGLPGVEEIEGNAFAGGANINLRFALGTDMKNALVEVIGRLNRLPPLPRDADRPQVSLGGNGNTNETLSWFFVQLLPGTPGPIEAQRRFIEDTVRSRLEAIPGCRGGERQRGPAGRGAHHPRPGARRGARHHGSRHRQPRRGGQQRLRRAARRRPPPVHAALHRTLHARSSSAHWCSPGATAGRCGSRTSPRSTSRRRRARSSPTRTAIRRSACRCSAPTARTCSRRSTRSRRRWRSCATDR